MEGRIERVLRSFRQQIGPGGLVFAAMQVVEQVSGEHKLTGVQKAGLWQQLLPQVVSVAVQAGLLPQAQAEQLMQLIQNDIPMLTELRELFVMASKVPELIQTVIAETKGCTALCKKK